MDESQNGSSLEKQNLEGQVMDSLGNPEAASEEGKEPEAQVEKDELPQGVKERLGRQEKRHQKELRAMQNQIQELHSRMANNPTNPPEDNSRSYSMEQHEAGSSEDMIHKAVAHALRHKELEEKRAKDQEKVAHVHKEYQEMQSDLDKASEKYEDFDDVVRSPDAPYSEAMRDAALLLPNRAEVLYRLGKDPENLKRISALHPLDQAREMVKLSHTLVNGEAKPSSAPRQLGSIKSTPMGTTHVTEKTSASDIRARMKAGNWK